MSFNGSGTFVINSTGQPVVSGTVISSTAFNALTADLANGLSTCITKDGQTTPTADIPMGSNKITGLANGTAAGDAANLGQVQSTVAKLLGSVSGADTITAVGAPTVAAYAAGQMFYFVAAAANTGAVTINIDSLGAKSITRDGTTALAAGDIQSGEVCVIVYDGTQFQLVNGASQSASIVTENLTVNKATVLNESGGDNDTRIEGDTDANLLFVDASTDRIGVGTDTPLAKFQVGNGTATTEIRIDADGGSGNGGFIRGYKDTSNASWYFGDLNPIAGGTNAGLCAYVYGTDPFVVYTGGSEKLRLDSSGNLGLGVTPSAWFSNAKALEYQGGSLWSSATSNMLLMQNAYLNASADYIYKNTGAASYYSQSSGAHSWATVASGSAGATISAWTTAMTLDASGRLIVGSTSSTATITANASGGGSVRAIRESSSATNYIQMDHDGTNGTLRVTGANALIFDTNSGERARITDAGGFLIATTNTSATTGAGFKFAPGTNPRLSIVTASSTSDTSISLYSTGAGAYRFFVDPSGTIYATVTTISSISDQRYKENIRDLDVGLDAVMALKPRKFDWKEGKGKDRKDDRGFIAQEFEQVFPDLVDEWKDPAPEGEEPYKSVRQDLIPVLVKAIQEQQAMIEDLKAKVAALEAK